MRMMPDTDYEELMNYTIYPWDRTCFDGKWEGVEAFCRDHHLEGIELYTGYEPLPSDIPAGLVRGVHLPFHSGWLELMHLDEEESRKKFDSSFYVCTTLEELYSGLRLQLANAAHLGAAYTVFHLSYSLPEELFTYQYGLNDAEVLQEAAVFLNNLVSTFPGREPPVRILFENLWYPGCTYADPQPILTFMDELNYKNYGFLLDTGHLINYVAGSDDENTCIDAVLSCLKNLPASIIDRMDAVHLHRTECQVIRAIREERGIPAGFETMQRHHQEQLAFQYAGQIDQHRPFTSPRVREILDAVSPAFLIYEFVSGSLPDRVDSLSMQRAAISNVAEEIVPSPKEISDLHI